MQTAYSLMVIFSKLTDEEVELVERLLSDDRSNSRFSCSNILLFEFLNIPIVCFMFLLFRFCTGTVPGSVLKLFMTISHYSSVRSVASR
jgi:hypothetical protein